MLPYRLIEFSVNPDILVGSGYLELRQDIRDEWFVGKRT